MAHSHAPAQFDELDPHGSAAHGAHAAHVIVGPLTLTSVLVVLLVLTVATVGQAQLEAYLTHAFHIQFPLWVNVVFCMVIALIKGLLVMAYFMQLRYDNPINSVVMLFTFFAFALFVGFTALDLNNRDQVYDWKAPQVKVGGVGLTGKTPIEAAADAHKAALVEKLGSEKGLAEFERQKSEMAHAKGHAPAEAPAAASTASQSRPRHGLSGALDATSAPASGHGDGHAAH